jgi:hypothetical protein
VERVSKIAVQFDFTTDATVTFVDPLEVSLDCPVCRRCQRTVVFREGQPEGKCTPTGHAFPGRIIERSASQHGSTASVVYQIAYNYEPFIDAKYPEHKPSGKPTWGRIAFEVRCPKCGQVTKASTQTNIVRPWVCQCRCGCVLYTEQDEQPVLSSAEAPDA